MCIHVQLCTSNIQAFVHQASRSNLIVDGQAQSSGPGPLQDQILASQGNESDEQLSPKLLSMSDVVAELMLFQDRLRIGDNRRQRRYQALHPVILAASEVDVWTAENRSRPPDQE